MLVSFVQKMIMVRLFTAAKLSWPTDLSRLNPRIPFICLDERYIPIFVQRYGCSNDLNKMTNLHCCHFAQEDVARQFFPPGFNQTLAVQYSVFNKNTNKVLETLHYYQTFEESRLFSDCRQITFVTLNGFCPLSNSPPPPLILSIFIVQNQDG